jgi:hypothetical protein
MKRDKKTIRKLRLHGVMTNSQDESVTLSFGKSGFYKMKTKEDVALLIAMLSHRTTREA